MTYIFNYHHVTFHTLILHTKPYEPIAKNTLLFFSSIRSRD
ncbi:uncharacterized protein METZ01_LOCUS362625, partial [marine metagenome]